MSLRRVALAAACIAVGIIVAAYIAGIAFFVLGKAMPRGIGLDTWLRYWEAYSGDPVQRHRLLLAAAIAVAFVFAAPLLAVAAMTRSGRSLHGDARWASAAEIRKAGLL